MCVTNLAHAVVYRKIALEKSEFECRQNNNNSCVFSFFSSANHEKFIHCAISRKLYLEKTFTGKKLRIKSSWKESSQQIWRIENLYRALYHNKYHFLGLLGYQDSDTSIKIHHFLKAVILFEKSVIWALSEEIEFIAAVKKESENQKVINDNISGTFSL